jgi:hypothetical protein
MAQGLPPVPDLDPSTTLGPLELVPEGGPEV